MASWVARFGVPETITSDRGTQFTSTSWSSLCSKLSVRHNTTTGHHPQANGLVERVHRQLKDALRARGAGTDWTTHLPWALLGLRAAPKEISGFSSAEAVFGQPLVLPGEWATCPKAPPLEFKERLSSSAPPATCQPRTYAEVAAQPPNRGLLVAKLVYIRRGRSAPPLAPAYTSPFRVVKSGPKFFLVEIGGCQEAVTVDRLKPHLGPSPLPAAVPPKRGQPPKSPASPPSASP